MYTDEVFPGNFEVLLPFISLCWHSTSAHPKIPDLFDFLSYTIFFKKRGYKYAKYNVDILRTSNC